MDVLQKLPYGKGSVSIATVQINFTNPPTETNQLQDYMYDLRYIKCPAQANLYRKLVVFKWEL